MTRIGIKGLAITVFIFLTGCSQRAVTRIESVQAPCPRTISKESDTLSYTVAFNDAKEREAFIASFTKFVENHPFVNTLKDTVRNFVHIQILPAAPAEIFNQPLTKIERAQIIEDVIEQTITEVTSDTFDIDTLPAPADSILPQYGGVVRLYIPRKTLDPVFGRLYNVFPFQSNDSINKQSVLSFSDTSYKRIILKINPNITNADKRVLSALDFIDIWTSSLKNHPAEGYALFRNVMGVKEFISGSEATVRGFSATDQNTIVLRLSTADSLATLRLQSRKLIDDKIKIGMYHISSQKNNILELLANTYSEPDKAYLDKIILHTGEDPNPILSFSLNKYDAVVLSSINDLEYARKNLSTNSSLQEIPGERYFLSCASTDDNFRQFLKNHINASELLKNSVKVEGFPIKSVITDDMEFPLNQINATVTENKTYKIIYCKEDQISKIIAEKLLAILSYAKISVNLSALETFEYEKNLVTRDYDCAIGWVPQSVTRNINEQLRLASIWFGDQTDVLKRIENNSEIPLFAVKRYLLKKNDLYLYKNSLQGLFWNKSDPQEPLMEN